MQKRIFCLALLAAGIAACIIAVSCTAPFKNANLDVPMNVELTSKTVNLTPTAPIEYDTSVPVIPAQQSVESTFPAATLILLYHNITTLTTPGDYDRNIDDFEADLQFLRDSGCTFIRLSDILKIQSGEIVPTEGQRFAVIVLDDGFASAYTMAFPLLKAYNIPATFFLVTANIGTAGFLTWSQVDEIASWTPASGTQPFFELGSHTVDHQSLAYNAETYPDKNDYIVFLNMELNQSKAALLPHVNPKQSSMFLALPYGDASDEQEVFYAAIRMGYAGIRTSNYGAFDAFNPDYNYHLPCAPIFGSTDISSVMPLLDTMLQKTGTVQITIR